MEVCVLFEGYSRSAVRDGATIMEANCSCVLVRGEKRNIIVDTMTPWDGKKILAALADRGLSGEDVDHVICTHGHPDHVGNNNLFLNATHVVGRCVSKRDEYFPGPLDDGKPLNVDECGYVQVVPSPGHTLDSVSVIVKDREGRTVAITGDLFEREEDIQDSKIWMEAGSEDPERQKVSRRQILDIADFIIPGHGKMFKVTENHRTAIH